jgi:hypothetical protein
VERAYVPDSVALFRKIADPAEVTAAEQVAPFRRTLPDTIAPDDAAYCDLTSYCIEGITASY